MKAKIVGGMLFLLSLFSAGASATDTLISELNGQVVYDQTTNLSWIADANLANTSTFGLATAPPYTYVPSAINTNGAMTWDTAQNYIAAMNAAHYLGYSDWRLPTADSSIVNGSNASTGELGNLFYNGLGQMAQQNIATIHNPNFNLFKNVQSWAYWSGTVDPADPSSAWTFFANYGRQYDSSKSFTYSALVVRSGNVAAVPEPSTPLMFGVGLMALIGLARRRMALG